MQPDKDDLFKEPRLIGYARVSTDDQELHLQIRCAHQTRHPEETHLHGQAVGSED